MEIARTGAHFEIEARHRFKIVVEHIRPRLDHLFQGAGRAFQEIGRQNFNRGARCAVTDGADGLGEVFGPAIVQIVAVHRGDDHMFQTQLADRMGHLARLKRVQRLRLARRDIAKGAAARAYLAHDHHGGVALAPAFADIGAARLFADRDQFLRL